MLNAVGAAQHILVLGGTSDIGAAITTEFLKAGPAKVTLAARASSSRLDAVTAELKAAGADVEVLDFDAADTGRHREVLNTAFSRGDVDIAIVAFGTMDDNEKLWHDHDAAVHIAEVNYVGAVSVGVLLAEKMKAQGHGSIVAISSVAGIKVRRSNFVYGSTKAGFDGFYEQLGEALRGSGVNVTVVRPGQVRTRMTEGLKDAPLTVDKEQVAVAVAEAVRNHKASVWCHPAFKFIASGLKLVPPAVMRKLPI